MGLSDSKTYYQVCEVLKKENASVKYLNMWSLIPDFNIVYLGIEKQPDLTLDQHLEIESKLQEIVQEVHLDVIEN